MIINKKCDRCLEEKRIEAFHMTRGKASNLCLSCKKIRNKEYRDKPENKEKVRQRNEKWRKENKEYFYSYQSTDIQKQYQKKYKIENKISINKKNEIYRNKNKDKINQYNREYKKINKEKNKKYNDKAKESNKQYRKLNKEAIRKRQNTYFRERKKVDILFKLSCNLRSSIVNIFNKSGYSKHSKTIQIIGCSFEELKIHLESKFEPWMTWENRGKYNGEFDFGWDIDHIIPISAAGNEEEVLKLNHYTNLQPLCSKMNRDIKKNKTNH